ncbi:hypothetical protein [Pseudomonas sp. GZD-222]|uniref:hypothetical protein n=1 Tax=Pseudomonas sp. GZD-222 TaxID=3404805 RepID=UPI003BB6BD0A
MKFSLDEYAISSDPSKEPMWVNSETKRKLFQNVCKEFEKIKGAIESKNELTIKERRIIARRVAIDSGVDPSLLSIRRQPEINNLIIEKNLELDELWNIISATKYTYGKKLTKAELHKKNIIQAAEIERLTNLRLAEALTRSIESQIIDSHKNLIAQIDNLKAEKAELQDRNSRLTIQLRQMMSSLNNIRN